MPELEKNFYVEMKEEVFTEQKKGTCCRRKQHTSAYSLQKIHQLTFFYIQPHSLIVEKSLRKCVVYYYDEKTNNIEKLHQIES